MRLADDTGADQSRSRPGLLTARAVTTGAAVASALLVTESILVCGAVGSWESLAWTPVFSWSVGVLSGGVSGLLRYALGAWASKAGADTRDDDEGWRSTCWLTSLWLGLNVVAQINRHLLPAVSGAGSIASSLAIGLAFVGSGWWLTSKGPVGPTTVHPGGTVLLASAVIVALLAVARPGELPHWSVSVWPAAEQVSPLAPGPESATKKLAVFALDGADWEDIDPLLQAGQLPNIAKLLQRAGWGTLRSEPDAKSPVVWTTIFAGRPAAAHGLTDWDTARSSNRRPCGMCWTDWAGGSS